MLFELLESRNLFSVSLAAGVLTVTGTNLSDAILINKNASGQLAVSDDGVLHNYAWGSVSKIVVNALGGNDSIISQNTMSKVMVVHGGDGADSLYGGAGNDSLFGDGGNDVIDGRKGNDDMRGGDGEDTVDYTDRVNDLTVSLDDVANDGVAGMSDNVHSDIEVVLGGKGNDHIYGGPTTFVIYGNGGNDSIYGGTGAAALYGGDGNDLLVGGSGATNYIYGGAGNDTIYTNAPFNYANGELGNDYIASYSHGYNVMYGDYGDDTLSGGLGENDLHGGLGNDRIDASRGTGMNWLNGDEGNDTLTGAIAGDTEERGGAGDDVARGGGGRNWIWGDAGNDQLHAGTGSSWVSGGDDADSLWGGAGADTLNGDGGADVIVSVGGGQSDVVSGGDGPDSFWVDAEPTEVITDADAYEGIINSVHRVGHFFNTDRELNGQSIADPTDSGTTKNFANDPLFSNLGPGITDVKQGAVGDCYFLTALMAASKDTWMPIRESVADLGDGTYAVQFWRNNLPYIVRVDADLPVDASGQLVYAKLGYQNSLWVPIMEKAFTYFRTGASTYASINFGTNHEALDDLHARQTTDLFAWNNGGDLLNYIQSELNAGKVVTISTPATITAGCPCVGSHAYLVMQVNYKTVRVANAIATFVDSVVLRNPWGVDGVSDGSDPTDGYVTVSANAAGLNFSAVTSAYV